jgi:negative regulator of sigma E activity
MQSQDSNTGTTGTLKHPDSSEWMSFLYGECAPERRRDLDAHLAACPTCTGQVQTWRSSMDALDDWPLPAKRHVRRQWLPILKWAAAAAVVLAVGFGLGRQTSNARAEVAALKGSIANLTANVQREHTMNLSNSLAMAATANTETLRLLGDYARLQQEQRVADQGVIKTALRSFDLRLGRIRSDLLTVAVNTEAGFEQTHENMAQLASYSIPHQE